MRVCIWYKLTKRPWGGSNSFLATLVREFQHSGIEVDFSPKKQDQVILVNSWSRGKGRYLDPRAVGELIQKAEIIEEENQAIRPARPLIQRLDGIARLYGRHDPKADNIQFALAKMADYVVFQSEFARASFSQHGIQPEHNEVIHNAVDGRLFYPADSAQNPGKRIRVAAISWSDNLMKGFNVLPKLAALPGVELFFIGNWNPTVNPGEVTLLGIKSRREIATILRGMHLLVHPAENDPCSNVILEGLASGLPVLFHDSGGNPELAGKYGLPLQDNLVAVIEVAHQRYNELREIILENRAEFLIANCAEKYLSVFEKSLMQ